MILLSFRFGFKLVSLHWEPSFVIHHLDRIHRTVRCAASAGAIRSIVPDKIIQSVQKLTLQLLLYFELIEEPPKAAASTDIVIKILM